MLEKSPVIQVNARNANVEQWGVADQCNLRPGYRLLYKKACKSDLLLLRPKGAGSVKLARYFGKTLLSEPHGIPLSSARWDIHAGVFAIETTLNAGVISAGNKYIKIVNANAKMADLFQDMPMVDEMYLTDVLSYLRFNCPAASVVVASSREQLLGFTRVPDEGLVWYLPKQEVSETQLTSAWLAPMIRERQRAASKMLQPRRKRYCQMHLPGIQPMHPQGSMASK